MTKICEKLIEEVFDPDSLSPEMRSHVQVCPECQKALAAVKGLKAARKPATAKEAIAIASIMSSVRKVPEADLRNIEVASIADKTVYFFTAAMVVVVVASSLFFLIAKTHKSPIDKPLQSSDSTYVSQPQPQKSVASVEANITGFAVATCTTKIISSESDQGVNSVSSQGKNITTEKDSVDPKGTQLISPDEEDINSN